MVSGRRPAVRDGPAVRTPASNPQRQSFQLGAAWEIEKRKISYDKCRTVYHAYINRLIELGFVTGRPRSTR